MIRTNHLRWFGLSLLLLLPAAAQQPGKERQPQKKDPATHPVSEPARKPSQATENLTYVIGASDALAINVWKERDISQTVTVRPDGKISLPLLGDVQAAGLTPMQLAATLREGLEKYINEPQVTVVVTGTESQRVYVLGEVNRPGPMSLLPKMTVLQAISSAGGPSQFANLKAIYILRNESGKQVRYRFNYKKVIRGLALDQNIPLRPGDAVVVP